ncbi:MAG: hypothetical protein WBR56_02750, partial [Sedimenticolaceae bacterium]
CSTSHGEGGTAFLADLCYPFIVKAHVRVSTRCRDLERRTLTAWASASNCGPEGPRPTVDPPDFIAR